jgi:histidinol-phosphate/aromatic aminotransferase/cobyric acid decarboxylase-like protein
MVRNANGSRSAAGRRSLDVNLNLNVRGLSQSATLAINERSRELAREGREVFRLGLGQSPFPVPGPVTEGLREHAHEKDYLPVKGLWELRQAVAAYHQRAEGVNISAEDILIGPGSKELMFIVQLTYYGDLVIPTPSWVSYAPQAHIIGRHIRWVPTRPENDWRLTPEELDRLCSSDPTRPRIIILNYPSNPTGDTYTVSELRELARVARTYRVVLLSDEIYGELHHRGQHVSIARYYPEGTIISAGLSKWCGAGGWRLGTFAFPPALRWLQDAMAVVASETYTSTSAPIISLPSCGRWLARAAATSPCLTRSLPLARWISVVNWPRPWKPPTLSGVRMGGSSETTPTCPAFWRPCGSWRSPRETPSWSTGWWTPSGISTTSRSSRWPRWRWPARSSRRTRKTRPARRSS